MSNIIARNIHLHTLKRPIQRCFSLSVHHLEQKQEEGSETKLSNKKIEDIIADFEKPLMDPNQEAAIASDPRTVLIDSIKHFCPRKSVLTTKKMTELSSRLNTAYTADQLRFILSAQLDMPRLKSVKKAQLVQHVIGSLWGLKTHEQVAQELQQRKLDTVQQSFPATRQELFFIIGDNGNTMRKIEQENDVKVTIDVSSNRYIVEGLSTDVVNAKKEIKSHLNIKQETMDIWCELKNDLKDEVEDALVDVSKVSGTFITLQDDKFHLASVSNESLENAKRLLNLMLADLQKKQTNTTTLVTSGTEFTVLPLHDSRSMSLYNRRLNWNRLDKNTQGQDTFNILENGQAVGGLDDIKDLLLKPFQQENDTDNISMEARFGNILFQSPSLPPTNSNNNSNSNSNITTIQSSTELLNLYKNRTIFFNTMPPRQLTSSFIPFLLDDGFHQRTVRLDYLNKNLFFASTKNPQDLKKLSAEFIINEQGDMTLKHITGIKKQSIMDILGAYGNVDIRVVANQFTDYTNQSDIKDLLLNQCKLTSYTELQAPKSFDDMILQEITFSNKKRYLFDKSSLITIHHIEQQDQRAKRTELVLNSVDPDTQSISNSVSRWPSFSNTIKTIAEKWNYSS